MCQFTNSDTGWTPTVCETVYKVLEILGGHQEAGKTELMQKVSFLLQTQRHVWQNIAGGSFKNTKGSLEKFPGCRKGGEKSNPKLWVEVMPGTGLRVRSQELEVLKSCRARRGGLKLVLGDMWEDSLASSWIFWRALLFVNRDKEILCQSFGEVARKVALIRVLEWKFTFMK